MNILLSYNEAGYLKAKAALENTGKTDIQNVIDEFSKLKISPLNQNELSILFKNPIELIFDKITGGELSLGGIAVDKTKAIEIIQKPSGYNGFIALVNDTVKALSEKLHQPGNFPITPGNIANNFELDTDNQVNVKESVLIEFKEAFKSYAKTEKARKALEFANTIIEAYKKSGIVFNESHNTIGSLINDLVDCQFQKPLTVKTDAILSYNR